MKKSYLILTIILIIATALFSHAVGMRSGKAEAKKEMYTKEEYNKNWQDGYNRGLSENKSYNNSGSAGDMSLIHTFAKEGLDFIEDLEEEIDRKGYSSLWDIYDDLASTMKIIYDYSSPRY